MTSDNQELDARAFALFEQSLKRERETRRDWIIAQAGEDKQLRDKTLALLDSDESGPEILMTGAAVAESYVDETPPERIGVYKIGEKLGQGGMGAVYKGSRDIGDFDHTVAIKLIKPGIISDNLKDRFAHEQQVMAGFSHPNIAHLHDGGTTDEGSPYIIMELIDGVSITDWVRQNNLGEKQCLDIFITICQAVSYAHQNLIIHRDLTPGNVLVTKDGVVKLIDFGIAKPYDEDAAAQNSAETPAGSLASLSFTPGFAAPERSKGAAANTLSDIYSLGKLLEDILPEGTMNTDLQAIYHKAIAMEPEARYASVDALIDDVKRYGSGYSVQARNGGAGYKFAKFIKRNSLATALGSIALAGLVGGLILTTSLYHQTEAARQEANARFQDVRNLANTMMFEIYDEISDVPGGTKAEVRLAEAAQTYLDDLAAETSADFGLKLEAATGFIRLARVQGSPSAGSQKKIKGAKANLESAEKLLLPLRKEQPQHLGVALRLNDVYYALAELAQLSDQNVSNALMQIDKAIDVLQQARLHSPGDAELQKAWIATRTIKSVILMKNNEKDKAVSLAMAVKNDSLELSNSFPDDAKIQRQVAVSLNNVGRMLFREQRHQESLGFYGDGITIMNGLLEKYPDNELYQRDMAYTLWRRAHAYIGMEDGARALTDFKEAIEIMQSLVDSDPNNKNSLSFRNVIFGESMLAYQLLHDYSQAEQVGLQYAENSKNFLRQFPDDKNRERDIMVAYWNLVDLYKAWGKEDKMCMMLSMLYAKTAEMDSSGRLSELDKKDLMNFDEQKQMCRL